MSRLVVALGGNALLRRGEPAEAETQRRNIAVAAAALAALAAENELVITHGNGPQVGLLALEADAYRDVKPYPLDVLGAESQGMIGYLIVQALRAETERSVVALVTEVAVDADDPAFGEPTKPIGPVYDEREARRVAAERGWTVAPDGPHHRRVVPSPQPRDIVELDAVEALLAGGSIVVCAGGGGIPVVREGRRLRGVEAVIDKDLTAALLAEQLRADRLLMLTDVAHVERDWRTPRAAPIERTTPAELRRLGFAAGSMAPKVEAACRFVERTGGEAAIGSLAELRQVAAGRTGTRVRAAAPPRAPAPGRKTRRRAPAEP
ncbi:MAG TPA: carbamate kinase [Gaiellaceae bacterium]|nr:carbamate kinase [Gaiellaceae bacterium]